MSDDRVWIAGGRGRMTNQAMNMDNQQAWFDFDKAGVDVRQFEPVGSV